MMIVVDGVGAVPASQGRCGLRYYIYEEHCGAFALAVPRAGAYLGGMDPDAPRPPGLDELQAALDRAAADVAAGRVVPAREVHRRLQGAITAAAAQQETHSGR